MAFGFVSKFYTFYSNVTFGSQVGIVRASDHQLQQPLVVGLMDKMGVPVVGR